MKSNHILLATIIATLAMPLHAEEAGWDGHVSLITGSKALDDKDWGEHDRQSAGGIISDFKRSNWPVSIAVDVISSIDDSKKNGLVESWTSEVDIGVRKIWELDSVAIKPYVGAGIAFVNAEQRRTNDRKQDDSTTGVWVGAGAYWDVSDHFNVGLDVRYTDAEVKLFDKDYQAGGVTAGLTLGFHY